MHLYAGWLRSSILRRGHSALLIVLVLTVSTSNARLLPHSTEDSRAMSKDSSTLQLDEPSANSNLHLRNQVLNLMSFSKFGDRSWKLNSNPDKNLPLQKSLNWLFESETAKQESGLVKTIVNGTTVNGSDEDSDLRFLCDDNLIFIRSAQVKQILLYQKIALVELEDLLDNFATDLFSRSWSSVASRFDKHHDAQFIPLLTRLHPSTRKYFYVRVNASDLHWETREDPSPAISAYSSRYSITREATPFQENSQAWSFVMLRPPLSETLETLLEISFCHTAALEHVMLDYVLENDEAAAATTRLLNILVGMQRVAGQVLGALHSCRKALGLQMREVVEAEYRRVGLDGRTARAVRTFRQVLLGLRQSIRLLDSITQ